MEKRAPTPTRKYQTNHLHRANEPLPEAINYYHWLGQEDGKEAAYLQRNKLLPQIPKPHAHILLELKAQDKNNKNTNTNTPDKNTSPSRYALYTTGYKQGWNLTMKKIRGCTHHIDGRVTTP